MFESMNLSKILN